MTEPETDATARQPDTQVRVPKAGQLAVGETLVFEFFRYRRNEEGFVLRHAEGYSAFVNNCPHWSVDLDLGDQHFFDEELERVYCKNHGALFHPVTGRCESGPCVGDYLESFEVELDGNDAVVRIPSSPLVTSE